MPTKQSRAARPPQAPPAAAEPSEPMHIVTATTDNYTTPCCHQTLTCGPLVVWRLAAGLTQAALAQRVGIGELTIRHIESGRHVASLDTALRLAASLGILVEQVNWGAKPQPKRGPRGTSAPSPAE